MEAINETLLGEPSSSSAFSSSILKEEFTVRYDDEVLVFKSKNWRNNSLLRMQILGAYLTFILFGLSEQTIGTLIPKLQKEYNINDIQISLIFLASTSGYFISAFMSSKSHSLLGVRGVLVMGITSMTLAFLIISHSPPYVVIVLTYIFNGIGFGSIDAAISSWMGNLIDSNEILGILHGCYGIGSMISPSLIAFLIDNKNPWKWSSYYLLLACGGSFCIIWISLTFIQETPKKYKYDNILKTRQKNQQSQEEENSAADHEDIELNGLNDIENDFQHAIGADINSDDGEVSMAEIFRSSEIWFLALILFVYVGNEVAFGQWIVSYMTRIKSFQYKTSSHLASTFWAGLTIGRILLGFATTRLFTNELRANFWYFALSFLGFLIFYATVVFDINWLLFPITFFTGMFVGPIFPTITVCLIKILPAKLHTAGIGFICAFGGGGGAVIPFFMGIIANSQLGLELFPVIILFISSIMVLLWLALIKKYGARYTSYKL